MGLVVLRACGRENLVLLFAVDEAFPFLKCLLVYYLVSNFSRVSWRVCESSWAHVYVVRILFMTTTAEREIYDDLQQQTTLSLISANLFVHSSHEMYVSLTRSSHAIYENSSSARNISTIAAAADFFNFRRERTTRMMWCDDRECQQKWRWHVCPTQSTVRRQKLAKKFSSRTGNRLFFH